MEIKQWCAILQGNNLGQPCHDRPQRDSQMLEQGYGPPPPRMPPEFLLLRASQHVGNVGLQPPASTHAEYLGVTAVDTSMVS